MIAGCSFSGLMNSAGMVSVMRDKEAIACTLSTSIMRNTNLTFSAIISLSYSLKEIFCLGYHAPWSCFIEGLEEWKGKVERRGGRLGGHETVILPQKERGGIDVEF